MPQSTEPTEPTEPTKSMVAEVLAALDLPAEARIEPAGGATGETWKVWHDGTPYALRCVLSRPGVSDRFAGQLAAMRAAGAAGLPVPEEVRYARTARVEVVLLGWLPGRTVADALRSGHGSAYRMGELMGAAQRALHRVPAPAEVADAVDDRAAAPAGLDAAGQSGAGRSGALLHLDWHPLNVLVDGDEVSGIVDWVNARRGHPLLDVARTYALFTVDPALDALSPAERDLLGEVARGWAAGYGPEAASIPADCLRWAGQMMLADLARRYAGDLDALVPLRRWTSRWADKAAYRSRTA
ncbi:Predicted kinase, aminoglycoside phosphotransferase (APT) family [Actinopolymorpha cephalotaxi]|uniref:Aminoglycoside phosphotransferase (APT) family kinase protein n=1 Tax=Actinopolymorpha cephalotaxi TaxID=504797 RepID=A0A1I2WCF0_9ACTN|nr:phosphotransferase [Actinopolymorpha cephalotaxi]NYH82717.1 aminoglycoside phosphotransferase (APT) family kinase protein [Actinopolymorpha cephalotaxi]SFG97191.1 Predicted kinase, aminoglycoside phosphotransferase (APT) family [Actinopolymorpha cephalotaxi]